jgi:hypothetical protein
MRWLAIAAVVVACGPPGGAVTRPAQPPHQLSLGDLVGGWRWMLSTAENGTTRVEDETWHFQRVAASQTQLVGRYIRTVEVRSDDRIPFLCNQRPWYRQRAVYDVAVEFTTTGFAIRETGYHAEPSPCDHGFRRAGNYTAALGGGRLELRWPGGSQVLSQIDSSAELPADPWPAAAAPFGPWRWDAVSYDDDGNIRTEHEWWEITKRTETQLDISYRRRVIVTSSDGKPIPCANATTWSFDDAYILDGQREEEHWHFHELAAEPGDHACLKATPKRNLDEATAEQLGDFFILEWRGKRRQVLYRPD